MHELHARGLQTFGDLQLSKHHEEAHLQTLTAILAAGLSFWQRVTLCMPCRCTITCGAASGACYI